MATLEENKAIVQAFVERVPNGGDVDAIDELCTPTFRQRTGPGQGIDGDGLKRYTLEIRQTFPDLQIMAEHLIAEGDFVMAHVAISGTHQGELASVLGPIAPTERRVSYGGVRLFRLEDGKIAETWFYGDTIGLLQQLDGLPMASPR